jgi:phage-related protein
VEVVVIHTLGDITFNDDTQDANGTYWYINDVVGWDSPAQRKTSMPFPSRHGAVTVENLYDARTMTVMGLSKSVPAANAYAAKYYLMSQLNAMATPVMFSVVEDIERYCMVYRSGEVRTSFVGIGAFRFELNISADDPFKYSVIGKSEALAAGVGETLVNDGTDRAYPTITLTATGTPTITIGSSIWVATQSMPSGSVIDMRAMTAFSGSTNLFDRVSPSSIWGYLNPGNNSVQSSVVCTVEWEDAWV